MFALINTQTRQVDLISTSTPVFDNDNLVKPIRVSWITPATHEVMNVDSPPVRFFPGLLAVSAQGVWSIPDQNAYDAELAIRTPAEPVPATISDRQFFHALALNGTISEAEALAAVKTGDPPAAMEAFISALPLNEQFSARMLLEGATTFERAHPLTEAFGAMNSMTSTQIDDLWRFASTL